MTINKGGKINVWSKLRARTILLIQQKSDQGRFLRRQRKTRYVTTDVSLSKICHFISSGEHLNRDTWRVLWWRWRRSILGWIMGNGGLGYLCCGLVCPRGCAPLPLSAAPVGISHTTIPVSTIGLGFPCPCRPMLTIDNFVSRLVSFISHLGALPGSWTVTTLLALS